MKCNVLIADDEQLARQAIMMQLKKTGAELRVFEAADGAAALQCVKEERPDIIFLDIQMPLLTGMELLRSLPRDYSPEVIVVSAYDNFAIEAFENEALDYLVKPFTDERFAKAFNRAYDRWNQKLRLGNNAGENIVSKLTQLLERAAKSQTNAITVKDGSRIMVVPHSEIMYFEAAGEYISVVTQSRKYLHTTSLADLEQALPENRFARIHKSVIVNTAYVRELRSHFNGDYTVVLKNDVLLKLSRNYRETFMSIFR